MGVVYPRAAKIFQPAVPAASAFGSKSTRPCPTRPAVPAASGRQCRQPAPLARRRRTHAPRAGGMGASLRFWWGGGGSRRRQAHEQGPAACGGFWGTERWGWMEALVLCLRRRWRNDDGSELRAWGDAALPRWGKGRCWVRGRRCLPRWGKGAAVWRAWFWLVRGEMLFMRRFALQEGLAGAPGGRGKTALRIRAHPSRAGRRARSTGGRGRRALRARRKLPALPATASFSQPSRGETGGLCPHPPKGPVPWVSLFGEPAHISPSPRLPVPPNAAGGKSLLVDLPPSVPSPPHQKRKEASMPPARGAWMRRLRANGAGRRHCRP